MLSFYLEEQTDGSWQIIGFDWEGEVSRETYFSLYIARMALYDLEDEGYTCKDMTR